MHAGLHASLLGEPRSVKEPCMRAELHASLLGEPRSVEEPCMHAELHASPHGGLTQCEVSMHACMRGSMHRCLESLAG
jgi:hypothetical protein